MSSWHSFFVLHQNPHSVATKPETSREQTKPKQNESDSKKNMQKKKYEKETSVEEPVLKIFHGNFKHQKQQDSSSHDIYLTTLPSFIVEKIKRKKLSLKAFLLSITPLHSGMFQTLGNIPLCKMFDSFKKGNPLPKNAANVNRDTW